MRKQLIIVLACSVFAFLLALWLHAARAQSDGPPAPITHQRSMTTSVTNVVAFGADPTCGVDSTAPFQNALNVAAASTGVLYIPNGCFLVSGINATNKSHVRISGNGDNSLLKVNGSSPVNQIWWDLSGSSDVQFENFKVTNTGLVVPSILFLAAGTAANVTPAGIKFNHVNIDAKITNTFLYAFNLAYSEPASTGAGGSSCYDSTWIQRNQGAAHAAASVNLNTAVAVFDGINSRGIASDYVTLTTTNAGTQSLFLFNCNFIDAPAGFGNGSLDNNSSLILVNAGQFFMKGGSVQCVCNYDSIMWSNSEDVNFEDTVFKASDGSGNTVTSWILIGGGSNGFLTFLNSFFSVPAVNGTFIGFGGPVGGVGGITGLNVIGPDVGGNTNNVRFLQIASGYSCSGFTPSNIWLAVSHIQMLTGANNVVICGSIDSHTILQNPGSINVNGGTDSSAHF